MKKRLNPKLLRRGTDLAAIVVAVSHILHHFYPHKFPQAESVSALLVYGALRAHMVLN